MLFIKIKFYSRFDATYSDRLGNFVNDSPQTYTNAAVRPVNVDGTFHLCIFAGPSGIEECKEIRWEQYLFMKI